MSKDLLRVNVALDKVALATAAPSPTPTAHTDRDMVFVPASEFVMGSRDDDLTALPDEKPLHSVYVDAFYIDRTEATADQYRKCVEAGTCVAPDLGNSCTYGIH